VSHDVAAPLHSLPIPNLKILITATTTFFVASQAVRTPRISLIDSVPPVPGLAFAEAVQTRERNTAALHGEARTFFAHGEHIMSETVPSSNSRITTVLRPIASTHRNTLEVEGIVTSTKFVASRTVSLSSHQQEIVQLSSVIVQRVELFLVPLPVQRVLYPSRL
jgi:short subunit dehydrogenase-like uncharacterized protein